MPILNVSLQGRFGNACMQVLFARGLAERFGYELRCDEWIGEKVFYIVSPRYNGPALQRHNELSICGWMEAGNDIEFRGYAQMQECMTYTRRQAREWLRFRPEIQAALNRILAHHAPRPDHIVAHRREGDYIGCGYPVISRKSYTDAALHYFGTDKVSFVEEENPLPHPCLPDDLSFLPDFYRLVQAPTLLRGNSSFSFVAGLLNRGVVLSPRINGLRGGEIHDNVQFEAGNHCKLSDHDFCSDLHVKP